MISWNHIFSSEQVEHGFDRGFALIDGSHFAKQQRQRHRGPAWEFRASASAGRGRGARRGLPRRATPALATPSLRPPCTPGTRSYEVRDMYALGARPASFKFGGDFAATSGRCGDSSRIAASTSTPTATLPVRIQRWQRKGLRQLAAESAAVKQRQAGIPQMNFVTGAADAFWKTAGR